MLDLESEAMRGLGSIPTEGNILSLDILVFTQYWHFRIACEKLDCTFKVSIVDFMIKLSDFYYFVVNSSNNFFKIFVTPI